MKNKETIICSAIYIDDKKEHVHQPINIKTGFVVCGHRHHNCFSILSLIKLDCKSINVQGFLTSKNRFVDRKEAMLIAIKAGQGGNYGEMKEGKILFSEDLY